MNYYERHIGDYLKDTAHLSLLEHGVYGRLLDVYYTREGAIPQAQVERLIGARTKDERAALAAVLEEFFTPVDGMLHNSRCDSEIAKYSAGEPEREVKKANEDNRLKRHRDERAALFKALTDAGQHAPWNIGMQDLRALVKALQEPKPTTPETTPETLFQPLPATAPATPATATQTPIPSHQTPKKDKGESARGSRLPPGWAPEPVHMAFAESLGLRNGRATAELEKFRDYWAAQPGQKGVKSDWPATWRNWARRAAEDAAKHRPVATATGETPRQRAARERVYEMTGGLVSAMPPGQTTEYIDVVARPIVSLG